MKLIKKLLPIATGLSSIAIVAPIITSCGNKQNMDLAYVPKVKEHDIAEFTNSDQVLSEYFNDAKDNTEITVQDYIWTQAQTLNTWILKEQEGYSNKSATYYANVKDLSFEKKSVQSKDYYLLSGTFTCNNTKKFTYKSKDAAGQETTSKTTQAINQTFVCTKLCLSVSKSSDVWKLSLLPNNVFDWEIHYTSTENATNETTFADGTVKEAKYNSSTEYVYNTATGSGFGPSWNSYYLKNVTVKQ